MRLRDESKDQPCMIRHKGKYHQLQTKLETIKITGQNVLILRLLMSYIYMEHLFLMFLDHTQRRSTVGRTPLDE